MLYGISSNTKGCFFRNTQVRICGVSRINWRVCRHNFLHNCLDPSIQYLQVTLSPSEKQDPSVEGLMATVSMKLRLDLFGLKANHLLQRVTLFSPWSYLHLRTTVIGSFFKTKWGDAEGTSPISCVFYSIKRILWRVFGLAKDDCGQLCIHGISYVQHHYVCGRHVAFHSMTATHLVDNICYWAQYDRVKTYHTLSVMTWEKKADTRRSPTIHTTLGNSPTYSKRSLSPCASSTLSVMKGLANSLRTEMDPSHLLQIWPLKEP